LKRRRLIDNILEKAQTGASGKFPLGESFIQKNRPFCHAQNKYAQVSRTKDRNRLGSAL